MTKVVPKGGGKYPVIYIYVDSTEFYRFNKCKCHNKMQMVSINLECHCELVKYNNKGDAFH